MRSATAVIVSTMIGTGIFLVTGAMALATHSLALVLVAWIAGALIALFGALCFAELGAALPCAGGMFVYLSRGLGPVWGYLFGWTASVLASPAGVATLAAGFLRFASVLFPVLAAPWLTLHAGRHAFTLTLAQPLAALVIVLLTALNYLSIRTGGRIQMLLATFKAVAIAAIILAGLLFGRASLPAAAASAAPTGLAVVGAVLTALVPVMWAFNGIQNLGCLGEEIEHPGRNLPRALLSGLAIVTALYLLINVAYFRVLPLDQVAASGHVASDVVRALAGSSGATWLTLAMCVSALATLHVVIMGDSRVPYALARAGLFFPFVARTHPRFQTPSGAITFLGALGALIALTGTFEELYSLYIFAVWIFFALTAVGLLRLRRTEPGLARPYRAWGYPWTPILFVIAAVALTVNLWMDQPLRSSLGLLVIVSGVPFFYYRARSPLAPAGELGLQPPV